MAEEFLKEEIMANLECYETKATKKQIQMVIDDLMSNDHFWDDMNYYILDAMRDAGIKLGEEEETWEE